MKLLRSLVSPRYSLSVISLAVVGIQWLYGVIIITPYNHRNVLYLDETLEKFGLSSIFSKCGILQRSTLSTFQINASQTSVLRSLMSQETVSKF